MGGCTSKPSIDTVAATTDLGTASASAAPSKASQQQRGGTGASATAAAANGNNAGNNAEVRRSSSGADSAIPQSASSGEDMDVHGAASPAAAGAGAGGADASTRSVRRSDSILCTIDKSVHNVLVPMEVSDDPFGRPIESVYSGVHDGEELGTGITGIVRKVQHRTTGHEYAVKRLDLGQVETEAELQRLRDEIAIMCQLDHPNVVRLEEVYESPTAIYLIQELCTGGDLFDRLDAQPDMHYTEAGCARIMKQIVSAVRYVHEKGIVHRDLKLENFMFSNETPQSELRMIDFGLSKHFEYGDVHDEAVGSAYTVAPEVIIGKYDERCDNWSIGVITYLLLSGQTPFGGAGEEGISLMQTRQFILDANYEFEPEDIWGNISQQAIDFIRSTLVTDPNNRPTAKQLQKSEWLQVWADEERKDEDMVINPNVVQALVKFKEQSDMFKLLSEVLSFTLLPGQLEELRRQFEIMDPEGRGEISLGALKRALLKNAGAGALGSLTEEEIEDIFNAMRIRKTEMRIHWHEFIAAALSQVEVDDRNLELAFERLDTENKGYIDSQNIIDLMGGYVDENEDRIREMWQDVFKDRSLESSRQVTKNEFVLLMKGQRQEMISGKNPSLHDSDSNIAVSLPEHTHDDSKIMKTLTEEEASPIVVNRMLYRAHRQTRLAVLEATRRFEEEQMIRTAKKLNEKLSTESSDEVGSNLYQAGLVMRHSKDASATSDSVREMVRRSQEEMQARIDKARKRSGRAHGRHRSCSDMAATMGSLSPPTPPPMSQRKMFPEDGSTPPPRSKRILFTRDGSESKLPKHSEEAAD